MTTDGKIGIVQLFIFVSLFKKMMNKLEFGSGLKKKTNLFIIWLREFNFNLFTVHFRTYCENVMIMIRNSDRNGTSRFKNK